MSYAIANTVKSTKDRNSLKIKFRNNQGLHTVSNLIFSCYFIQMLKAHL